MNQAPHTLEIIYGQILLTRRSVCKKIRSSYRFGQEALTDDVLMSVLASSGSCTLSGEEDACAISFSSYLYSLNPGGAQKHLDENVVLGLRSSTTQL